MSQSTKIAGYRSFRLSLRWLPEEASEPTSTIVLTGARSGVFIDTRFFKGTKELDWAFAGYRLIDPNLPDAVTFRHLIDSRTLVEVEDKGTNSSLVDGTTLEVGEMVNPATKKVTSFEEIWQDEEELDGASVLFLRNTSETSWQGRVGNVQMALGRDVDTVFWAWQAVMGLDGAWVIKHSTPSVVDEKITFLPANYRETEGWKEGSCVSWADDRWVVLEHGRT